MITNEISCMRSYYCAPKKIKALTPKVKGNLLKEVRTILLSKSYAKEIMLNIRHAVQTARETSTEVATDEDHIEDDDESLKTDVTQNTRDVYFLIKISVQATKSKRRKVG